MSDEALHRLRHAAEEKLLSLLLATMTVGCSDKFINLRDRYRGEQLWEYRAERPPQPHIEEVRQVGVADVVIVRRIGGEIRVSKLFAFGCSILLPNNPVKLRRDS